MPIRRATAERIARSLLDPFIKSQLVTDAAIDNAIEIIQRHVETEDCERVIESAGAAANMHTALAQCYVGARR